MRQVIFDADLELEASNTRTADGYGTALAYALDAVYPYNTEHHALLPVVFDVSAIDTTDTDETYALLVQVDTASGFSSPKTVVNQVITATGRYIFVLDLSTVAKIEEGAAYIRSGVDVGGTTPSITYAAFLTKL